MSKNVRRLLEVVIALALAGIAISLCGIFDDEDPDVLILPTSTFMSAQCPPSYAQTGPTVPRGFIRCEKEGK